MSITAKELAIRLGLSEAAVSMALNNKSGVSTYTRKRVIEAARENGYDFSRISHVQEDLSPESGTIYFVIFRRSGAVVPYSTKDPGTSMDIPFFTQLSEGISSACKTYHYFLHVSYLYSEDDITSALNEWKKAGAKGLLLLGTEMNEYDLKPFLSFGLPFVLLDNYFENMNVNSIMINNVQGAYNATQYLIRMRHSQPGYLKSSYVITGFEERADGFYKALRRNGLSTSQSIVHHLSPSVDGAYYDMKEILNHGEPLADCYFADNDQIAAGVIRALTEAGKQIPRDTAIVGFDDMPLCSYLSPPLTTVHVPKQYMGELAVHRLHDILTNPNASPVKIEVSTDLCKRKSV